MAACADDSAVGRSHWAAFLKYAAKMGLDAMEKYLSTQMPFWRFALHTLVISLACGAPLLVLYVLINPGLASHLVSGGPALARFLRQVVTNGLPVVFVTNYVSFFIYAVLTDRYGVGKVPVRLILSDLPLRVALFLVLHALTYVLSAQWYGSFGGSKSVALGVVAPTLVRSALFANLSGVYFYAVVLSALPLYLPALERGTAWCPAQRRWRGWRFLATLAIAASFAALLAGVTALIIALGSG
ncbi:MAG: hypothetical protein COB65_11070 [Thalassobium sp.]|nr:MAG: hypothetical protein COB65_11070 [Thalassobium sp.]